MCKKLSILCLVLVVVALSMPASAAPPSAGNPLLLDINGDNLDSNGVQVDPARTQTGWDYIDLARSCGVGPFTKNMQATVNTTVTFKGVNANGSNAGSRNRMTGDNTNLANMQGDLFFVQYTGNSTQGLGVDYVKVDFTITGLAASSTNRLTFSMFAWDPAFGFNPGYGGAGEPAYGKRAAWSLTCPTDMYPSGYDINDMPADLQAELLGADGVDDLAPLLGHRTNFSSFSNYYRYATTFCLDVTANPGGVAYVTLYGWNHMTSWAGSKHMPLCGIRVVPEPATVALLGLGGLALLRRRKRA